MKLKEPYRLFRNRCVLCECTDGTLHYKWATDWKPGASAREMGHIVAIFQCANCGTITVHEEVPVITAIVTLDEQKED